jgi:hypothetical protein
VAEQPLVSAITYCSPARLEIYSIVNPPALHAGGAEKNPHVFIPKSSSAYGKVLTDDIGQD